MIHFLNYSFRKEDTGLDSNGNPAYTTEQLIEAESRVAQSEVLRNAKVIEVGDENALNASIAAQQELSERLRKDRLSAQPQIQELHEKIQKIQEGFGDEDPGKVDHAAIERVRAKISERKTNERNRVLNPSLVDKIKRWFK
jgi:hypothetical protein